MSDFQSTVTEIDIKKDKSVHQSCKDPVISGQPLSVSRNIFEKTKPVIIDDHMRTRSVRVIRKPFSLSSGCELKKKQL